MKLVFLNVWHGGVWNNLQKFVQEEKDSTDLFCFTEVDPSLHTQLLEILSDFNSVYDEILETKYLNGGMDGQSVFIKKGINLINVQKKLIFDISSDDAGIMQVVEVGVDNKRITVGSVHGMARPGEKLDTPERLSQSQKILDVFKNISGPKVIGGDFNLLPETESVAVFEGAGYTNLIKKFSIKNTRNRLSWERFENIQYYADYCFVSKDIKVEGFEVPNLEVSDHQPLVLTIDF